MPQVWVVQFSVVIDFAELLADVVGHTAGTVTQRTEQQRLCFAVAHCDVCASAHLLDITFQLSSGQNFVQHHFIQNVLDMDVTVLLQFTTNVDVVRIVVTQSDHG